jgi:hypothetical protein
VVTPDFHRGWRQEIRQRARSQCEATFLWGQRLNGAGSGAPLQSKHGSAHRLGRACGTHGQCRVVIKLLPKALRACALGRPARQEKVRQLQVA